MGRSCKGEMVADAGVVAVGMRIDSYWTAAGSGKEVIHSQNQPVVDSVTPPPPPPPPPHRLVP